MARIPIYQQQLVPNAARGGGRISGGGGTGAGLQALGAGLDRMAGALERREEVDTALEGQALQMERERIETEARVWFAKSSSEADLAMTEHLQKTQQVAKPGAPGFTPDFLKSYDEYSGEAVKNAPSQLARQMMQGHLQQSREAFGRAALVWEAGERARYTGQQVDEGVQSSAKLVYGNPEWFEREIGKWTATVNGADIDEQAKEKLRDANRGTLVGAAVKGWIDQNPTAAHTILKDWSKSPGDGFYLDVNLNGRKVRVPFGMADFKQQQALVDYAEKRADELRQDTALNLRYDIQNAEAMARTGVVPTGPARTREEFSMAFKDPATAEHEWARYTTARQTASTVASLQGRSTADLLAVIQTKPNARDPNFAVTAGNQEIQARAAVEIIQARQQDPVAYAIQTGDFKLQALNPQDPAKFSDELKRRAAALPGMVEKYGKGSVLSKDETSVLTQQLELLPADRKVDQLDTIRRSIGDDAVYASMLNAMRPDSPVTALVGNIAVAGSRENARLIAMGEDLLNPTKGGKKVDGVGAKFPMPPEADLRAAWVEKVGDAYRGYPDAEATAYQAFKAYYAAVAAQKGLNDPKAGADDRIVGDAIKASTGGVARWKTDLFGNSTPSANIVLPYGMGEDVFRDRVSAEWLRLRGGLGYAKTDPGDIGLYNTGANGEYMVMSGTSWLPDKNGKPVILRITGDKSGATGGW